MFCIFSSVAQSCPTLCNPMNCGMPGLPVHHQLPEFTQTHVDLVGDAIQPSHPLLSPFPPAPNPSEHQGLFQWVNSSHEVAKVLEFQPQHQSFQWTPRTGLFWDGLVGSPCSPRDSQESSPAPQFKSINSSVLYVKSQLTNTFSLCTRIHMYVCIIYMTKIWQTALKLTTCNEFWIFYSFWFYSPHFEKPYLGALFAGWLATWLAAGVLRTTKWWELQLNDKSNLVFKMGLNKHFSKENTQMPNKHMKRCSTSLIIRKMQIKTKMSTTSHPLGRLLSKTQKITNIGEDMGKLKPLLHCWWEYKMVEPLWKMAQFPQKSRALPCDLAIPFLGKYL